MLRWWRGGGEMVVRIRVVSGWLVTDEWLAMSASALYNNVLKGTFVVLRW